MTIRYEYDPATDIATIEGIRYDGLLLREYGVAPVGTLLRIIARTDGVLTVRREGEPPAPSEHGGGDAGQAPGKERSDV